MSILIGQASFSNKAILFQYFREYFWIIGLLN